MLEFILKPWHLIVLFLASHLNREQHHSRRGSWAECFATIAATPRKVLTL